MNILEQIKTKLQNNDINEIVLKLGYKPSKSAKVTQVLTELLNASNIAEYLDKSYYDFKYNSRTLLKSICRILEIPKIDYAVTIEEYEDKKRRLSALKNPYIFVDTNFKRKGETIIALASLESKRRIKLNRDIFLEKSKSEIDTHISIVVKLHYKWKGGKLPLWGNIRAYFYYDTEGKKTTYSVLGDVIENMSIQESRARVTLNNKTLIGV